MALVSNSEKGLGPQNISEDTSLLTPVSVNKLLRHIIPRNDEIIQIICFILVSLTSKIRRKISI